MIKIMLISKKSAVLRTIEALIQDEELGVVAEASNSTTALDQIENTQPDLLVVHVDGQDFDSMQLLERMVQVRPRTFPILVQEDMTIENVQAANAVGVHNIIGMPSDSKEFTQYLHSVYLNETGRIEALKEKQSVKWSSKIYTVFGAKDGLGKTSLAVNLAVYLASKRKKVALLDFDLSFGDICMYMDLEPKETIGELMQDTKATDIDTVQTYMAVHNSGVHVLGAPKSPEYAEIVSAERVQRLLAMLRTYYDYVVIDASSVLNDVTLTALESSTKILLMTTYDLAVLKNTKLAAGLIESLNQKEKIRIVLGRVTDSKTITIDDVGKVLNAPISCAIPNDAKTASSSLNKGQPFITALPTNKMSQAIADLAEVLMMEKENFDILNLSAKERKEYIRKNKAKETGEKKTLFKLKK